MHQSYIKALSFEHLIKTLLENFGYEINQNERNSKSCDMEIFYKKSLPKRTYKCEIKFSKTLRLYPLTFAKSIKVLKDYLQANETGLCLMYQ